MSVIGGVLANLQPCHATPPRSRSAEGRHDDEPDFCEAPRRILFELPVDQNRTPNASSAKLVAPKTPKTSPRIHDKYGSSFFSFNPGLLDDRVHWSTKALQKLCRQAKVDETGTREEVIKRLRDWHNKRDDGEWGKANKFALLPVKTVPDKFMGPYQPATTSNTPGGRTPLKSCLRKQSAYSPQTPQASQPSAADDDFHSPCETAEDMALQEAQPSTPERAPAAEAVTPVRTPGQTPAQTPAQTPYGTPTTTGRKRRASLHFSPYNKVQLISPREGKEPKEGSPNTPRTAVNPPKRMRLSTQDPEN